MNSAWIFCIIWHRQHCIPESIHLYACCCTWPKQTLDHTLKQSFVPYLLKKKICYMREVWFHHYLWYIVHDKYNWSVLVLYGEVFKILTTCVWVNIFQLSITDKETQTVVSEECMEHPWYYRHHHCSPLYCVWHISDNCSG